MGGDVEGFGTISGQSRADYDLQDIGRFCWAVTKLTDAGTLRAYSTVAGGHAFAAVTAGLRHSCGLDTGSAPWCWGHNTYGELGDGTTTASATPVPVVGGIRFATPKR